jgi:zinc protease
MKFVFAGTRVARRDVIGTDATLKNANAELLRQYYDRWYRPDNMIVVVVGDTDPDLVEEVIRQRFASLQAADAAVDCPDFGRVAEKGTEALYVHEPNLGYTNVTIESVWNEEPRPYTRAEEIRLLKEYVAGKIMDNRLQHLVNQKGSPITRANFYSGRIFKRLGNTSLDGRTSSEHWREVLQLLDTTLRQALRFGFTGPELDRVRKELLTMLKKQVQTAGSRDSSKLADGLIYSLNKGEVSMSPEQELALYEPILQQMTLAEINNAFQGLWHKRRLVEVTGTVDLTGKDHTSEEVILQACSSFSQKEISPWVAAQTVSFPYLAAADTAAEVVQHTRFSAIGVDRYLLSNGVTLNLKQTDFQPNEVNVAAAFGNGRLAEPMPGLGLFAQSVVKESGVGGLTREQLSEALAAYSSRVSFQVAEDSFQFVGKGLTSETELLFQLLSTHLQDPAFRPAAYQRAMEKMEQMYGRLVGTVEGMMQLRGERFLAGNNPRYGIVPLSDMQRFTLKEVRQWMEPILKQSDLEISVVGDFNPEQIISLAGRYFSERRNVAHSVPKGGTVAFPSGKSLAISVDSASDRAMVTVAWPTDDFWDISRTRRLSVLASILDDRLRRQIREELGATYSPVVYNRSSRVDPGFGILRSQMIVDPAKAEMLTKKLLEVGTRLAKDKVSQNELERALEPTLTSIRDLIRSNRYWLASVLVLSSRHPQQLKWPLTIKKDFAAISVEDISTLARKYLQPNRAAQVIVRPN